MKIWSVSFYIFSISYYLEDEGKEGEKEAKIKNTGKKDPKRHLGMLIDELLRDNIGSILGRMIATKAFWLHFKTRI